MKRSLRHFIYFNVIFYVLCYITFGANNNAPLWLKIATLSSLAFSYIPTSFLLVLLDREDQ